MVRCDGVVPTKLEEFDLEHPIVEFQVGLLKGHLQKLAIVDYEDFLT